MFVAVSVGIAFFAYGYFFPLKKVIKTLEKTIEKTVQLVPLVPIVTVTPMVQFIWENNSTFPIIYILTDSWLQYNSYWNQEYVRYIVKSNL